MEVSNAVMHYREMLPQLKLRPFINCFWTIQSRQPAAILDRTFPDGCQEISFNIDSTVLRSDGGDYSANPRMELIGQMTRPYDIIAQGSHTYFGVKFYPHSFSAFTRESIYDLRDQSIDLSDLLTRNFNAAADSVFEQPNFEWFVTIMEAYFLHCLASEDFSTRSYEMVDQAVRILLREKQNARVDDLHRRLGVGCRSLQKAFQRHIGLSPKQLLKMIRFQTTFQYLHDKHISLTDIAHRCGYYDQAHFAHDFKALAGVSASTYRTMQTPLNGFFLDQSSYAYLCNYKD